MSCSNAVWWISLGILLSGGTPEGRAQTGDGLLGVPWGTSLVQMRGRFLLAPADSDAVYTRYTSDIRRIGDADIEECILEFRAGAFAGAAVLTRGADNTHRLLAYLLRVFGKGKEESVRAYQWLSETTHLFYDEDSDGDGYVYWYSRRLFADVVPEQSMMPRHPSHREKDQ
jgi:hypothetical protein